MKTRPHLKIQDLYKLLYLGEFGIAHILQTPPAANEYLKLEAASQRAGSDIPLTETCSADGSVIRVNLRPFIARNLSLDALFQCMMETAERINGSLERLKKTWTQVGDLVEKEEVPILKSSYRDFTDTLAKYTYPEMHHSREYTMEYKPSYRVVLKMLFEKYFPGVH